MIKGALEDNVLTLLCWSEQHSPMLAIQLDPEIFSTRAYRDIAAKAIHHIASFSMPPCAHLRDLFEDKLRKPDEGKLLKMTFDAMEELHGQLQPEYVLKQLDTFIASRRLAMAVEQASDFLHQGELDKAREALFTVDPPVMTGPGIWLSDPKQALAFLNEVDEDYFPSGMSLLDDMGIRPERKTMTVFIAPAKRGKCLAGDTLMQMVDGSLKTIRDVVRDKDVDIVALDVKWGVLISAKVTDWIESGTQQCYLLETHCGNTIKATAEHKFYTPKGWMSLSNIKVGTDSIAVIFSSNDRVAFDKVVKIEKAEITETYDITVADHHNFIANNIVAHNSWWLIEIGKQAMLARKSVLHITLEMSEQRVAQRYIQSLYALTSDKSQTIRVPIFKRDETGHCHDIDFDTIVPEVLNADSRLQISRKLRKLSKKAPLKIKEFPTGSLTLAQLNAYLDYLRRVEDFTPDMLIIDYPNLMNVPADRMRIELGRIFQGLRGIAVTRNMAVCTVTQGNRISSTSKSVNTSMVAEDYSIIGTADMILTYSQTAEERGVNLARVTVAAARNMRDQFTALISQSYASGQFCLDSVYMQKNIEKRVAELSGEDRDAD